MWSRPLRRRRRRAAEPEPTRTPVRLTSETRLTASLSCERTWYLIDIATGAGLDGAEHGHPLTLPTGHEVTVTGHDRPWTLTWRDPHPGVGTLDSGGAMELKEWIDSSTTISLSHFVVLPEGSSWRAVRTHQELLDTRARLHARAWVDRLARHGAATVGSV
ncbi:hypothetical protein [Janibacter alittae]|uniref:Uncharacterized protein n=1 Tax=Janibacter alittae TaxID=3115209 RepID=A0ABZ2MD68_9MICO